MNLTTNLRAAPAPANLEADRQLAIDRLTDAFSSDLISMEEYERRAQGAQLAATSAELRALTADLGGAPAEARRPNVPAAYSGPEQSLVCVMGDKHLAGDWLEAPRVTTFTCMGSTTIDFTNVRLPAGPVRLEIFLLMGDVKIVVPRGLPVRMNATAIMADSKVRGEVSGRTEGAPSWIDVSGLAVMGSILVRSA